MAAEHVERIGQRIERRRKEMELNRRELAQRVGGATNENAVYRWERGKHRPEDATLELLAHALEVDVAYFMTPEPLPGAPDLMNALSDVGGGEQTQLDRIEGKLDLIILRLEAGDYPDPPADLVSTPPGPKPNPKSGQQPGSEQDKDSLSGDAG